MAEKEQVKQPEQEKPRELVPTTLASKFVDRIMTEFAADVGAPLSLNPYQKTLAQHLYLKADSALKELEAKRLARNGDGAPIVWENVNVRKLAVDAAHRINLGLDALIPNHIHIIPYFNRKLGKYDLDLRIGYEGKLYYKMEAAIEKPVRIISELVYSNDEFQAFKFDMDNDREFFQFKITKPFDRGDFIGGFGYIMYEDPRLNILVTVPKWEFDRAEAVGNKDFWKGSSRTDMLKKTLMHRILNHLKPDPRKINSSYAAVEEAERDDVIEMEPDEKPIRQASTPPPPPRVVEVEQEPMNLSADDVPEFMRE